MSVLAYLISQVLCELQVLGNECVGISNIPGLVQVTSFGESVCWHI